MRGCACNSGTFCDHWQLTIKVHLTHNFEWSTSFRRMYWGCCVFSSLDNNRREWRATIHSGGMLLSSHE